jgi:predicted ATPase
MIISKVALLNWRNFRSGEANLSDVTYVLGPNAAGKSNFLDVFRFLRDIAKSNGGGLQKAVSDRGSLKKLRCLHARTQTDVGIDIEVSDSVGDEFPIWRYEIHFNSEGKGRHRPQITKERVIKYNADGTPTVVLNRPDKPDMKDVERLTQTAVEQIHSNQEFRDLVDFFGRVTYVHLVPQLLKFADMIGGRRLEDDPFGQGFLERLAKASESVQKSRLKRIEQALQSIIPHMEQLRFVRDEATGLPHLEAKFKHHRPQGAIQREDQFSDGTLRLISLFWLLLEGQSLLLLEEPELSLNEEVVAKLPHLLERIQKSSKKKRQVVITTHSQSLLSNAGISGKSLLILTPSQEGTTISSPNEAEMNAMANGFSPAEVVLPRARKVSSSQSANSRQMELTL